MLRLGGGKAAGTWHCISCKVLAESENPSEKTFEELKPYIQEAYEYAKEKFEKHRK